MCIVMGGAVRHEKASRPLSRAGKSMHSHSHPQRSQPRGVEVAEFNKDYCEGPPHSAIVIDKNVKHAIDGNAESVFDGNVESGIDGNVESVMDENVESSSTIEEAIIFEFIPKRRLLEWATVSKAWNEMVKATLKDLTGFPTSKLTDKVLISYPRLTTLFLSSPKHISNQQLRSMTRLRSLTLCYNQTILGSTISQLTNLTYLDISLAGSLALEDLRSLSNLTDLRVQRTALPEHAFDSLTKLTTLHLDLDSPFSEDALQPLTNLVELRISSYISPDYNISMLTKLTCLAILQWNFATQCFAHMPTLYDLTTSVSLLRADYLNLVNLRRLAININNLEEGDGLEALLELESLRIDFLHANIHLSQVGHKLLQLPNLRHLQVYTGSKPCFPGLEKMTQLTSLTYTDTQYFPEISTLRNLTELNVSRTTILDESIAPLVNLTSLNVYCCQGVSSEALLNLTALVDLTCTNSNISAAAKQTIDNRRLHVNSS